jgi:ATP-dependent Clp protease ATP-binding subunit ClpA
VVDKFVMQLEAQLADRNVTIELSQAARDWLATKGYDKQMGARPLSRVIQQEIKKPLADQLLFGDLITGGHVKVDVKDGKAVFEVTAAKVAPKKTDDDAEDDTPVEDESPKEPVNVR